jgi:hypothetical protein
MPKGRTDKPKRWDKHEHATGCVECCREFVLGDMVHDDGNVTIHAGCRESYRRTLAELEVPALPAWETA